MTQIHYAMFIGIAPTLEKSEPFGQASHQLTQIGKNTDISVFLPIRVH